MSLHWPVIIQILENMLLLEPSFQHTLFGAIIPKCIIVRSLTPKFIIVGNLIPKYTLVGTFTPKYILVGTLNPKYIPCGSLIPKYTIVGTLTPKIFLLNPSLQNILLLEPSLQKVFLLEPSSKNIFLLERSPQNTFLLEPSLQNFALIVFSSSKTLFGFSVLTVTILWLLSYWHSVTMTLESGWTDKGQNNHFPNRDPSRHKNDHGIWYLPRHMSPWLRVMGLSQ